MLTREVGGFLGGCFLAPVGNHSEIHKDSREQHKDSSEDDDESQPAWHATHIEGRAQGWGRRDDRAGCCTVLAGTDCRVFTLGLVAGCDLPIQWLHPICQGLARLQEMEGDVQWSQAIPCVSLEVEPPLSIAKGRAIHSTHAAHSQGGSCRDAHLATGLIGLLCKAALIKGLIGHHSRRLSSVPLNHSGDIDEEALVRAAGVMTVYAHKIVRAGWAACEEGLGDRHATV